MRGGRAHQIQPPVIGPPVVVRVHRAPNPAKLDRVAGILLDIIDTAERAKPLDAGTTPGKDDRP